MTLLAWRGDGMVRAVSVEFQARLSTEAVKVAIKHATHAVAPVWPLSSFVAVNPFMGLADRSVAEAAHAVARTAGARMTMPRKSYLEARAASAPRT